jgi:hypothetical protein
LHPNKGKKQEPSVSGRSLVEESGSESGCFLHHRCLYGELIGIDDIEIPWSHRAYHKLMLNFHMP